MQVPPADYHRHWYMTDDSQATDDEPDHPSQATNNEPDHPGQATDDQPSRRAQGIALPAVRPRPAQFSVPMAKGLTSHCVARVDAVVQRILHDYKDISCRGIPTTKPKHGFEHVIETTGAPVRSPCRRLDPAHLAAAKKYFDEMESAGVVATPPGPHHCT